MTTKHSGWRARTQDDEQELRMTNSMMERPSETGDLEFVGFADQVDGEVEDDFEGFVFVEAVLGYEAAEEGAVDAAGYVVAGGDGEEGAGVVVEADGVVEAGGLGGLLAEGHHAFGGGVEQPSGG